MTSNNFNARTFSKHKTENTLQGCKSNLPTRIKVNKSKLDVKNPVIIPNIDGRKQHNCLPLKTSTDCKKTPSRLRKKSMSLVELTHSTKIWPLKKFQSKEQGDEGQLRNIMMVNKNNNPYSNSIEEMNTARKVCIMFILHAWRKRRSQVRTLENKKQKLENQVSNLNLQTFVLRGLLESEKQRVAEELRGSAQLKLRLVKEITTTEELKNNLNMFETEKSVWENTHSLMTSEIESLKEEINLSNMQIKDLKEECTSFQNNWYNSKEKESQLLSKLEIAEMCLQGKICELQSTQQKSIEFETKIAELVSENGKLQEEKEKNEKQLQRCVMNIKNLDGEVNNLQNKCNVQNEKIMNLSKDFAIAKKLIHEKEVIEKSLKDTILKFESEKEESKRNMRKLRNAVIFEAIRLSANLLLPIPHCVIV